VNRFGKMFAVTIFGESHGPKIGAVIDGCPPGIPITTEDMLADLARRKSGARGTTTRHENDIPTILSGVFNGKTTGTPLCITFDNNDTDATPYEEIKDTPRPGHADLTALQKYQGYNDYRGGGHSSGRLTAPIVAAGTIAKKILGDITIKATIITPDIEKAVDNAIATNDSIGAIIQCQIKNIPPGLGEPFFDSIESLISHAIFAIPGIKGIEFGAGFSATTMPGSEYNDTIINTAGKTSTNHSGGINGGITNGNDIIFRVAVRPTATISQKQNTVNLNTGKPTTITHQGRHDTCFALRTPVIIEAMAAITIADFKCQGLCP